MTSILVRSEMFYRILFPVILYLFENWPPAFFRKGIAVFFLHIGGIHSGCAMGGLMWLIYSAKILFETNFPEGSPINVSEIFTKLQ